MVKDVIIPKTHVENGEAMTLDRCVKIEDAQVYLLLKVFYIKCLKDVWHRCNIQMVVAVLI